MLRELKPVPEALTIEQGQYGLRGIVTARWSSALGDYMLANNIYELELNYAKGWEGDDLLFLAKLPDLIWFKIIDRRIKSVAPVHDLHRLRTLEVLTYCRTQLNFGDFPHLTRCALEWRRQAASVFQCTSLRELFVHSFSGHDVDVFGNLLNLESLSLLSGPVRNVRGLASIVKMRSLRLGNLRQLNSLEGIGALSELLSLDINTCRKIARIDEVGMLASLEVLALNNCGPLESIKPLNNLNHLITVLFDSSTDVIDGDLSPLTRMPLLTTVAFRDRRHYSVKRDQFP